MYDELIKRLRECTAEQNGEKTLWHQAADAIEELQQITTHYEEESKGWWLAACDAKEERERLKEQIPRWIPVTERLPEYMENVLVTDGAFSGMGWRDYYDCHGTKPREDYWIAPSTNVNELGITHWMPLPQPPEVET